MLLVEQYVQLPLNSTEAVASSLKDQKKRYSEIFINQQIDKVKNMKRKQLRSTNKVTMQDRIPVDNLQ